MAPRVGSRSVSFNPLLALPPLSCLSCVSWFPPLNQMNSSTTPPQIRASDPSAGHALDRRSEISCSLATTGDRTFTAEARLMNTHRCQISTSPFLAHGQAPSIATTHRASLDPQAEIWSLIPSSRNLAGKTASEERGVFQI